MSIKRTYEIVLSSTVSQAELAEADQLFWSSAQALQAYQQHTFRIDPYPQAPRMELRYGMLCPLCKKCKISAPTSEPVLNKPGWQRHYLKCKACNTNFGPRVFPESEKRGAKIIHP